jgi:hypothetical protein
LFVDGGGNKLMLELSGKQSKMGRRSLVGVTNKVWTTLFKKRNTTWNASFFVEQNETIFLFMLSSPLGFYIVETFFSLELL